MLQSLRQLLLLSDISTWRGGFVRWNPICHGSCDVPVIPPTDDEVVVVGVRRVNDGQIGWDDWWITWSCDPEGDGGLVRWLFFRPGITKPRPGKSGRRSGSRVLPTDLCDVGLELVAFRLGDSTCSNVARLVVTVDIRRGCASGCTSILCPTKVGRGSIFRQSLASRVHPASSRIQG